MENVIVQGIELKVVAKYEDADGSNVLLLEGWNELTPYVVASGFHGTGWCRGEYYREREEAIGAFRDKVKLEMVYLSYVIKKGGDNGQEI